MRASLLGNPIFNDVQFFIRKFDSILFTFLNELVEPVFSLKIKTAAVAFSRKDAAVCVQFLFNKEFWDGLNYNEKNFVFIHEVQHVIFRHGIRGQRFLEKLPKEKQSFKLLNICQDICINQIAVDQYMKDIPRSSMPILKNLCFIETVFKSEHQHLIKKGETFEYYYEKFIELYGINEIPKDAKLLDTHGYSENGEDNENEDLLTEEELEELESLFEEMEGALSSENFDIDELEEEMKSNNFIINDDFHSCEKKEQEIKKGKNLDDIFKIVIKKAFAMRYDINRKSNWFGFNRRTSSALAKISPDLNIPVNADKRKEIPKKHKVLVYLDVSGSCKAFSERFMTLVGELPEEKYETHINIFADRVCSVNVGSNKGKKTFQYSNAGFGTNINKVIYDAKIKMEKVKYDAIFILTDGQYTDIKKDITHDYGNWYFFMTPLHKKNSPEKSTIFKIDKL